MKKLIKSLLLFLGIGSLLCAGSLVNSKKSTETSAESYQPYPGTGSSGQILFVTGSSDIFNSSTPVAVYFWNNSGSAWSDKVDYRVNGAFPVILPKLNGGNTTWSQCIITRYDGSKTPSSDGWGGKLNQSGDISLSILSAYGHNTLPVTGKDDYNQTLSVNQDGKSVTYFSGIKGDNHIYLDLSSFASWEQDDAKFAVYFARSNKAENKEDWSLVNSSNGYALSFMWKVNGQTNTHLYECIVPGGSSTYWNLVIAVRFNKVQGVPGWYNVYNQTQDLVFSNSNKDANMIHVSDWGSGSLDAENSISKATRLEFYGQYFLNNVSCSGHGNSDATTSEGWNNAQNEYKNHLSTSFQGDVWTCVANKDSESKLAQAMARYDYIVLYKQYNHTDFINRADSPNKTTYSAGIKLFNFVEEKNNLAVIIVVVVLSVTLVGVLFLYRKRKLTK